MELFEQHSSLVELVFNKSPNDSQAKEILVELVLTEKEIEEVDTLPERKVVA